MAGSAQRSEPLLAVVTEGIGEVPVQREHRVLNLRVHAEMEPFDRLAPTRHAFKCQLELGQITDLDHQMELAETRRTQAQLAPGQTPSLDQPLLLEVAQ